VEWWMTGLLVGRCPKIFVKLAKAHHTLPLRFSIVYLQA
jgi:hypothetical protein